MSRFWLLETLLKNQPWAARLMYLTTQRRSGISAASMCAKGSPLRAQRCAARRLRLRVRRPTRPRMWQALRAKEDARVYAELQSKQRAAYGDDEAAREAAGKAALLRAKKLLSPGWAARLCCEQRGRLAAVSSRLRGVRQRVQAVGSARECARERATRERKEKKANGLPFENY